MLGIFWFVFWQTVGVWLVFRYLAQKRLAVRLWLGSAAGLVLSMWAPVPFAFFMGFTSLAHLCAVMVALVAITICILFRRREIMTVGEREKSDGDKPLYVLLPVFFVLYAFMLVTHTLRSDGSGALYSGQCSYGDMCMHLSFITSMAEQGVFPFEYNLLPGTKLCYPFLCDSVSASLYLLGTPLRAAYILPMLFAMGQVLCGVWFLAREIVHRRGAAVLAFLLFFLNGGLGMIYFVKDYSLTELFTGFYVTPTNLTECGMRWVNVIADMLLPQRATLFGWAALFAVLYLLYCAVFCAEERAWLPAGIFGGLLPMVHTHSYLALGLIAFCWLIWSLRRNGLAWFSRWLRFGLPAVLLALPQVLIWTLDSVGGNEQFLRLGLDWVNQGQENWLWFWLKNVGVVSVATPLALIFCRRDDRAVFSGALLIFVLGELILFQPNPYDNNKLFYVAYLFACFLSADLILLCAGKLRRRGMRAAFLTVVMLVASNAALFTLAREVVSGLPGYAYMLFSAQDVEATEYITENTAPDAVFLTDDNHNNAVASLTGRNIVCGSSSYLYYHGLDYGDAQRAAEAMLTDTRAFETLRGQYNVDYVYFGNAERWMDGNIYDYLRENYTAVFENGNVTIFDVQ